MKPPHREGRRWRNGGWRIQSFSFIFLISVCVHACVHVCSYMSMWVFRRACLYVHMKEPDLDV